MIRENAERKNLRGLGDRRIRLASCFRFLPKASPTPALSGARSSCSPPYNFASPKSLRYKFPAPASGRRILQNLGQGMHSHRVGRSLRGFCALFERRRHPLQFGHLIFTHV